MPPPYEISCATHLSPSNDCNAGMESIRRPFACHFCDAHFTRKEHQTRHEQAHYPRQEFACRYCQRSFRRKDVLVRHERVLHKVHSQLTSSSTSGSNSLQSDMQLNLNNQPDRPLALVRSRVPESPTDGGDDRLQSLSNSAVVSCDFLQTVFDIDDVSGLLQEPGVSDYPRSYQRVSQISYPTPISGLDLHAELSTASLQDPFGLDLDAYGPEIPPWDQGGSETSPRSSTPVRCLAVSNCKLIEKLVWFTSRQLRPVPFFYLDESWNQTPQGNTIQACLTRSALTIARASFQRWIHSYFLSFHPHVALIHTATFRMSECHHVLLLCMAAIGAMYTYNRDQAFRLYEAASGCLANHRSEMSVTQRMQATLLLAIFDSWSNRPEMHAQCSAVRGNLMSVSEEHLLVNGICLI